MLNTDAIAAQVRRNCAISDAQHAGLYSICGLALRLRDLYKWEHGHAAWHESAPEDVLAWIGDKEDQWDALLDEDYSPVTIAGKAYDPFDSVGINKELSPHGLYYSAGYGHSLKPSFLLATVREQIEMEDATAYYLGRELARDLVTIPALSQDKHILIRGEAALLFLWDQMLYINKSGLRALEIALAHCQIHSRQPDLLKDHLDTVFAVQKDTYLYHELGEIRNAVIDRGLWRQMVATFPRSTVELLARVIKDLLADTDPSGPLMHIINHRNQAALAFYIAFMDGLAKEIFPHIRAVFADFCRTQDWGLISAAVAAGRDTAGRSADVMMRIYEQGMQTGDTQWIQVEIEKRLPWISRRHRN